MADNPAVASTATKPSRASRLFGRYIIKNRLQFKFSMLVFGFLGLAAFVIWVEGNWVINRMINQGLVTDATALGQLKALNHIIFYTGVLALAITFGLSLFFSHFVAGPIYRMEKTFEQMKEGDLSVVIRLRQHDELQDTAKCLNEALMSLRHKIRGERDVMNASITKIREFSEKLRSEGKKEEAAELDKIIFELQNSPPQIKI